MGHTGCICPEPWGVLRSTDGTCGDAWRCCSCDLALPWRFSIALLSNASWFANARHGRNIPCFKKCSRQNCLSHHSSLDDLRRYLDSQLCLGRPFLRLTPHGTWTALSRRYRGLARLSWRRRRLLVFLRRRVPRKRRRWRRLGVRSVILRRRRRL